MIVPEGYSAPEPPRRPSASETSSIAAAPLSQHPSYAPPPFRQRPTAIVGPEPPHSVEIPLASRSANGRKLVVASYTADYLTVCPASADASEVMINGSERATFLQKAGKVIGKELITVHGVMIIQV